MAVNFNNNPKKRLLIFFVINFIIFYIINKSAHSTGIPEDKQSLSEELLYSLWMGTFMTVIMDWRTVKSVFSKKKQDETGKF